MQLALYEVGSIIFMLSYDGIVELVSANSAISILVYKGLF